jgi:hypothetical protein
VFETAAPNNFVPQVRISETQNNYFFIMRNFIICSLHEILLRSFNRREMRQTDLQRS